MLNIATCDNCMHVYVCSKRNRYERFAKAADRMYVRADCSDPDVEYVKDCDDIVVDIRCKYFKRDMDTISVSAAPNWITTNCATTTPKYMT